jgi:hypothetical protein
MRRGTCTGVRVPVTGSCLSSTATQLVNLPETLDDTDRAMACRESEGERGEEEEGGRGRGGASIV